MRDLKANPRPNHRLIRTCGSCKHFVSWNGHDYKGKCVLPHTHLKKRKDMKTEENWEKFTPTYISCVCDNHEWKSPGRIKQMVEYSDTNVDDIS